MLSPSVMSDPQPKRRLTLRLGQPAVNQDPAQGLDVSVKAESDFIYLK
jgi:hypothetical protein